MKTAALILASAMLFQAPVGKDRVYILCYHGFSSDSNSYSFLLNELNTHIDYLQKEGFKFVSISDVTGNNISGSKNILVTVDDGNKTVYEAFHKVFKPRGIMPILAIYPAIIGREKYALTWEQLKSLSDDGCAIAAHGFNHLYVNEKLYKKDKKAFMREISKSKSTLEEKLNIKVDMFVYPFGVRSEITKETLKAEGYTYAFTIAGYPVDPNEITSANRYELPRYMLTRENWKGSLKYISADSTGKKPSIARKNKKKSEKKGAVIQVKPAVGLLSFEKADDTSNMNFSLVLVKSEGEINHSGKTGGLQEKERPHKGETETRHASIKNNYFRLVSDSFDLYEKWMRHVNSKIEVTGNKFSEFWKSLSR